MKRVWLIALLYLSAGCYVGPNVQKYGPAISPAGIESTVQLTNKSSFEGELLTIEDTGVALLSENEIIEIPSSIIDYVKIKGVRSRIRIRANPISDKTLARLRPLCRFPAGIPDEALSKMLATRNQSSVRVISVGDS